MQKSLVEQLRQDRPASHENWPTVIAECTALMIKAAEEIDKLSKMALDPNKCRLLRIPYGANESIDIAFEGSCEQIKEFVRKYEINPETTKRCSFVAFAGSIIPATEWAPIDQVAYEPLTKLKS